MKSFQTNGVEIHFTFENRGIGSLSPKTLEEGNDKFNLTELLKSGNGGLFNVDDVVKTDDSNIKVAGLDPNVANICEWVDGVVTSESIKWKKEKTFLLKQLESAFFAERSISEKYRFQLF